MSGTKCKPLILYSVLISVPSLLPAVHENAPLHQTSTASGLLFAPVTPCRIADTRTGSGVFGAPSLAARSSRTFPILESGCGIPIGAQAYSLNITVVPHESLGYLTTWPTGQPRPTVSTLNSIDGRVLANAAIVPAGNNGAIDVFVTNETDVVIDVNGYFTASGVQGLAFYTLAPCRVVETRSAVQGQFAGPALTAGSFRTFIPSQSACGIPQSAQAFAFNVTVVPYGTLGYLTAWPDGQAQPLVSTLNSINGDVLANAAIVPAGVSGGAKMFVTDKTDLIVDANGYFGAATGISPLGFVTVTPCRVADTRNANGPFGGPFISRGGRRSFAVPQSSCGIPAGAQAYSLNITAVPHGLLGYLTTWATGQPQPLASTLNSYKGQVVANAAIVPAGTNGSIDIFASDDADVVIDVNGYFTAVSASVTQPAVTSVYPASQATGIALNSGIVLGLNTAVDPASASQSTVKLMNGNVPVNGTVSVSSDGLYIVFVPASALLQSTVYTVSASGLTTPFTHTAVQSFSSSFTSGTATDTSYPTITTSPPANSTVPTNVRLTFQSSTRLNPASTYTTYFYDQTSYGPSIPVTLQFAADGFNGIVTPLAPLAAGRNYYGYLYLLDIFGHSTTVNFQFTLSFAADTQGPTLTRSGPANGDAAVPLNAAVVLAFDQAISSLGVTGAIQLLAAGQPVPVRITLNSSATRVTISPLSLLAPNTTYSLQVTSQIVDIAGNSLLNPGSIVFQTGAAVDLLAPAVTAITPNGSGPLNAKVRALFNKRVNPATLDNTSMQLVDSSANRAVAGSLSLSDDGLTATFTPTLPLTAGVSYYLTVSGPLDVSGTPFAQAYDYFTLTTVTDTAAPSVLFISPAANATGVPVNAVPDLLVSESLDPTTITAASVALAAGSIPVAVTVTNPNNGSEIIVRPSSTLAPSTLYTLTFNGLKDLAGNALPLFTSSFTTSATGTADTTAPTLSSADPLNHATGVAVNKVVTLTFSEPISPVSASRASFASSNGVVIQGTYVVTGAVLTFTPQAAWPGNTTISSNLYVSDYAGNVASASYSFTTTSSSDSTPPAVTSITPSDGATGLGGNLSVVVTFSKPLDPNTVSSNTFAMYNGSARLSPSVNRSSDSKTVTLTGFYLPAPATITVVVTHDVKDLAGNALGDFTSQFTTAARNLSSPAVVTQRPGPGATGIPGSTAITLVLDKPLDPSSVTAGFHVTQNGTLFPGAIALVENGQAIRFTPSQAFQPGALVQVFLAYPATDTQGFPARSYQGSFTIDAGLSMPLNTVRTSGYNLPSNGVFDVEFNQDLDPATVTAANVSLSRMNPYGGNVSVTVTLLSPRVIRLTPAGSLTPSAYYSVNLTTGLHTTKGVSLTSQPFLSFYTIAGPDNTALSLSGVAPGPATVGLGTNTVIRLRFSKAVNPITANDTNVRLSSSGAAIPVNFSFSTDNRTLTVTPNVLLSDLATVTLAVSNVQDLVGRSLSWTSTFTTGASVDTISPVMLATSVAYGATDVPVNSSLSVLFSEAVDAASLTPDVCSVSDSSYSVIPGTYSVSADLRTVTFAPAAPFPVHRSIWWSCGGVQDLAGNQSSSFGVSFTTSFNTDSVPPQVLATNPDSGMSSAPINSRIQILFNEPVQATSLGSITLTAGAVSVAITPAVVAPGLVGINTVGLLAANTAYTLSIAGVRDLAGNLMIPVTATFSTGPGADLISPSAVASPPGGVVGTNATVRLHFSERVNRVSVLSSFTLYSTLVYGTSVPSSILVSADGLTAALSPNTALTANASYNFSCAFTDVAGNSGYVNASSFSTGSGPDNSPISVLLVNPPDATAGVPVNATVSVQFSKTIDFWSAGAGSVTLTGGSTAIPGTVALGGTPDTIRFAPAAALLPGTVYTLRVNGVTDYLGNPCPVFVSTFTTNSSATPDTTAPQVSAVIPANGATGVPASSSITLTYSEPINPLSIRSLSIATGSGVTLPVSAVVSGATVVLTPSQQLPGNTIVKVTSSFVQDLAGNSGGTFTSQFTTGAAIDFTPPTVIAVSPVSGQTGVNPYTPVILTFSKPLDPATVTSSSIALLNGVTPVSASVSRSQDSRTVTLNASLPYSTAITVVATHDVTDLVGNHLADFSSLFTTGTYSYGQGTFVSAQTPTSGSVGVPANIQIVLTLSAPMITSTLPGAVHVSENGVLVSATVQVQGTQTVLITPSRAFVAGALVQVFLDTSALDTTGLPVSFYSGQFTVQGNAAQQSLEIESLSPTNRQIHASSVLEFEFNKPLAADSINGETIVLLHRGLRIPAKVSLRKERIVRIVPRVWVPDSLDQQYVVRLGADLRTLDGEFFAGQEVRFREGDKVTGTPEIGLVDRDSSGIRVRFSQPVNPLTVDRDSLQVLGPEGIVPASVAFSDDDRTVVLTPFAPIPAGLIVVKLRGIEGGNGDRLRERIVIVPAPADR